MIAVMFEVWLKPGADAEYLEIAGELRSLLDHDGLLSIERFGSLFEEGKMLSLSFWRDEASIAAWRNVAEHRLAQQAGRERLFERYRIRVAAVSRDYSESSRGQAPVDSVKAHG